jgi:hypothetical protein
VTKAHVWAVVPVMIMMVLCRLLTWCSACVKQAVRYGNSLELNNDKDLRTLVM